MYKKQVGSDYSECRDESSGTTSELSVQKCHSEDFVQNRFQVSATKMKKYNPFKVPHYSRATKAG